MKFVAESTTAEDFDAWVERVQALPYVLTQTSYTSLAQPSMANKPAYYRDVEDGLYDAIVEKFNHAH